MAMGGYDSRFVSPGGGLVNLDVWERLCADPAVRIILLLGEATFHQVHGGIATNNRESPWEKFHAEYQAIRGKPFEAPQVEPLLVGRAHPASHPSIKGSVASLMRETPARQLLRAGQR
jgi:hypothetical protein